MVTSQSWGNKQPTENLSQCSAGRRMKIFTVYKFVVCKFLVTLELFPPSISPSLCPIHPASSQFSPPISEINFRVLCQLVLFPPLIWEPQTKTLQLLEFWGQPDGTQGSREQSTAFYQIKFHWNKSPRLASLYSSISPNPDDPKVYPIHPGKLSCGKPKLRRAICPSRNSRQRTSLLSWHPWDWKVLQWTLEYIRLFQLWFPQGTCPVLEWLCHSVILALGF